MKKNFLTTTPWQTKKLGEALATELLKKAKVEKRTKFSLSKEVLTPHHFLFYSCNHPLSLKSGGGQKRALVISLEGDLGGGKTTFLQGFARGLGIKEKILSPTFIIMRKSKIQNPKSKFRNFYHLDCYRIKKPKEILDLGFKGIVSGPRNIVAIEWADQIKKVIPKGAIWVSFAFLGMNKRKIAIKK